MDKVHIQVFRMPSYIWYVIVHSLENKLHNEKICFVNDVHSMLDRLGLNILQLYAESYCCYTIYKISLLIKKKESYQFKKRERKKEEKTYFLTFFLSLSLSLCFGDTYRMQNAVSKIL